MPQSVADQTLWEEERKILAELKEKQPELFVIDPAKKAGLLSRVGITALPEDLPAGYIRYSPLDFLVEEIGADGQVVEIADGPRHASPREGQGTVWADMVKIGISTLDAVRRVADGLGVPVEAVRYSGIKDAVAVTAQHLSIRQSSLAAVEQLAAPNVILKNLTEGKGALAVGELAGNRFTLFIRTPEPLAPDALVARVRQLQTDGIVNYYGVQRFGSPRFLSHLYGLHLCRGDLAGAVKTFLTEASPTEVPVSAAYRSEAASSWGDWAAMRASLGRLPYTFRHENAMLDAMVAANVPNPFFPALAAIPQQVEMWARAYASYLANRLMSKAARGLGEVPAEIPLLLTMEPDAAKPYGTYLRADGTVDCLANLRRFRFVNISKGGRVAVKLHPKFISARTVPEGVAICFELPKAAYATTVLMNMFDVQTGWPIPEWLKPTEYDTKELLGVGSLAPVRQKFASIIEAMMEGKGGEEE